MTNQAQKFTAYRTYRCWLANATNYFGFLEMTGSAATLAESDYSLSPGELKSWARKRVEGCLENAQSQYNIFADDGLLCSDAQVVAVKWSEKAGLSGVAAIRIVTDREKELESG